MTIRWRRFVRVFPLLLACVAMVAGCGGSSESTSRADVKAVAVAERELGNAWRRANVLGKKRCLSKKSEQSASRCFRKVVPPRERAAQAEFSVAIEKVLAGGVGSDCADALEEAMAESQTIPLFPGDATAACRAESRGNR
jgi:hypothetical protein